MQWLLDLSEKDRLLKREFESLSRIRRERDLVSYDARAMVLRRIRRRMRDMQETIDGQIERRSSEEQSAIAYQIVLELPVYSHLNRLISLLS